MSSFVLPMLSTKILWITISLRNYPLFVEKMLITVKKSVDYLFTNFKNDAFICFLSALNYRQIKFPYLHNIKGLKSHKTLLFASICSILLLYVFMCFWG